MSQIIEVIKALQGLARVGNITEERILAAETELQLRFAEEYREYLSEFGAVSADGMELTGIISVEYRSVVFNTLQEWELNPSVPHSMYVIENTYVDGMIMWQDADGEVYCTVPFSEPEKIADSLAEYIQKRTE